jgi:hypothetical protein
MSNGPGTSPQLPALASQVWGCHRAYATPVLLWRHLKGRGFACLPNCPAAFYSERVCCCRRLIEPFADRSALSHLGRTSGIWAFVLWDRPLKSIVSALAVGAH